MANVDYETVIAVAKLRANLVLDDGEELGGMTSEQLRGLIDDAIEDISKDLPRKQTFKFLDSDVDPTTNTFDLDTKFDSQKWDRVTDSIFRIESPIDQPRAVYLSRRNYDIVDTETGSLINFLVQPSSPWRISVRRRWEIETIKDDRRHRRLLGVLAGARAARVKEAKFGDMRDNALDGDSIDYGGKAAIWSDLAESLEAEYARAVKRPNEVKKSAGRIRVAHIETNPQFSRLGSYLVHRRFNPGR